MKYYNYEDTGVTDSKYPSGINLFIETTNGNLYMKSQTSYRIYKSIDKGDNWIEIVFHNGYYIASFWHDRANGRLYFIEHSVSLNQIKIYYILFSDDSIVQVGATQSITLASWLGGDVFLYGGNVYFYVSAGGNIKMYKYISSWSNVANLGGGNNCGLATIVGTEMYFLQGGVGGITNIRGYNLSSDTFDVGKQLTTSGEILTGVSGMAYDDVNYLLLHIQQGYPNTYLWKYNISANTAEQIALSDLCFMLNRNTSSGVLEKGFIWRAGGDNLDIFQITQTKEHFRLISTLESFIASGYIKSISDNFVIIDLGAGVVKVWEYKDLSSSMTKVEFAHEIMYYSEGTLGVDRDKIALKKGMFMSIEGKYTSAGSSSDKIIFEGIVVDFDGERLTKVWLDSPAKKELLKKKPRGDFSGRSDEIMTTLLSTYCKYMTKGTFSVGTAMGTVTYAGDKSLMSILIEFALFEKWIWKLRPQGELDFNDGTVDSLVDLSSSDKIWMVKTGKIREPYNYFYIKGAIVSGVQLYKEIEEADDLTSQELYGYNPEEKTYASFNSQSIVNQLVANIKAVLKETPLVVEHWHYDASIGMIAIGETVTFVYNTNNVNITSDQFLNNRVLFKGKENAGGYIIADKLV